MRAHQAFLLCGVLAAGLASAAVAMQAPTVVGSPQAFKQTSVTDVNRALKGDRLPLVAPGGNASTAPASAPRLPEGCEAAVSAMTQSPLAHTPARCLS